jgi:hypothetical protein
MATKRNNVSLAHDLEFISKDTGLDVVTIIEKAIRVFIARYKLEENTKRDELARKLGIPLKIA